ncbi:MAG: FKBP-type peptidyl-prolyl cis-trans isomerase [Candidatus Thermoplasmatota archaeon]|nr:FKBP-type peptidyl-prolyl cis-trans isomerase [Candidatus Thermoplasmatota archaeon]
MESAPKPSKQRDPQKIIMAILVAAIILSVAAVGYVLYERSLVSESQELRAIASGDTVTMNYIGRLADGRVFDTSLLEVAYDDVIYPKSLTFTRRSNDSYESFLMTAGLYGPGGTIKGFALGVLGMYPGQVKTVTVEAEDGYAIDPDRLMTVDLNQVIPATETMSEASFRGYFAIEPIPMRVVPHYLWEWNVRVISVSGGYVTVRHEPVVGQVVTPFGDPESGTDPAGWYVRVEAHDPLANGGEGTVTVRHLITSSDVYNVKGTDADGNTFVLWDFDEANETFQVHKSDATTGYNAEISGRDLFFEITILTVLPA